MPGRCHSSRLVAIASGGPTTATPGRNSHTFAPARPTEALSGRLAVRDHQRQMDAAPGPSDSRVRRRQRRTFAPFRMIASTRKTWADRPCSSALEDQNAATGGRQLPEGHDQVTTMPEAMWASAAEYSQHEVAGLSHRPQTCDRLLEGEIFCTITGTGMITESWRRHRDVVRFHGSLRDSPRAPEILIPAFARAACNNNQRCRSRWHRNHHCTNNQIGTLGGRNTDTGPVLLLRVILTLQYP